MMDGVVLHVSVKLFKDEDSTLLVYRDLLGQDIIRREITEVGQRGRLDVPNSKRTMACFGDIQDGWFL